VKRWLKFIRLGVLGVFAALAIAISVVLLAMGACTYYGSIKEKQLESIHLGDTEATVIAKMGPPHHIETPDAKYKLNFSDRKCQGQCAKRFWYHNRICLDEEWFVEFDKNDKVITSDHIISP
jgi:hypothetical protein